MNQCKICGNSTDNRLHVAREMMFGTREKFTYLECSQCGCVQLMDIPDLSKHYPKGYYSFRPCSPLKRFLRHQWASYAYRGRNWIGWLISNTFGPYGQFTSIHQAKISPTARILDVGCGAGDLIQDLHHIGFKNVSGVDPFIERDLVYPGGPTVYRKELAQMQGVFDVIMLHVSFEHMDKPAEVMSHLSRLLDSNGLILMRIPVANSYGWRHYGVNWFHLDAPRHLYIYTPRSLEILSNASGLEVCSCFHEGGASTFWASEQYARDIPLFDPRSYAKSRLRSIFTRHQIGDFERQAEELNRQQDGDIVCYYLRKKAARPANAGGRMPDR